MLQGVLDLDYTNFKYAEYLIVQIYKSYSLSQTFSSSEELAQAKLKTLVTIITF